MRIRFWIFAALVFAALAAHLALVSPRIAQTAEDTLRSRLATASAGVRTQIELIDLRTSPRAAAVSPEVVETLRAQADSRDPASRPDDRALRAVAAHFQPEPDLLVVATARGAALARRGKTASFADDPGSLPAVRAALDGATAPRFVAVDGALYRASAARVPSGAAVVIAGTLVDDRLAAQIRSQVDADVTILQNGSVVASSLPQEARPAVARWSRSPSSGYGVLTVWLPTVGTALSGKLPRGASRIATRGALVPLDSGIQGAVTVPAGPYLGWLGRYQAFYLTALALFVLGAFFWGLLAGRRPAPAAQKTPPAPRTEAAARSQALVGADVSAPSDAAPRTGAPAAGEVPWESLPRQQEIVEVSEPRVVARRKLESLDPDASPAAETAAETATAEPDPSPARAGPADDPSEPAWSAEPFTAANAAPDEPSAEASDGPLRPLQTPVNGAERFRRDERHDSAHGASVGRSDPSELGAGWEMPGEPAAGDRGPPVGGWDAGSQEAAEAPAAPASPVGESRAPPPSLEEPRPEAEDRPPTVPLAVNDEVLNEPPTAGEGDADDAHFFETFQKFLALREQTGESGTVSYEKFVAKLRKNREELIARHRAKGVRFSVYLKDGRAAIKASAIR
jgi:hypothetical protein